MIWIAAVLASLVGVALGLTGGGGSILMVPILVYVLNLPAREAAAMSLLAIGATSVVALMSRARSGNVRWRTAGLLGSAGMLGAFAGGKIAVYVPEPWLLGGFASLMLAASAVMFRHANRPTPCEDVERDARVGWALAQGVLIGFITGVVGAGGGFLIVPSLVLFSRLPMREASATSLAVLSMQSTAGFFGHAGELELNWPLTALIGGCATVGSLAASMLSAKVPQKRLLKGFGWLAGSVGTAMLAELAWSAASAHEHFAEAGMALAGGALIGAAAAQLWVLNGRIAGVSGIVSGVMLPQRDEWLWRALFLVGLLVGGTLMGLTFPSAFAPSPASGVTLVTAGLLVGVGTSLANGCTSGHGVCGVSRLSPRSLVATASFMLTGMIAVYLVRRVVGG